MRMALSWALWWLGDLTAKLMRLAEPFGHLYPVYNRLMLWSSDAQGEGQGPWQKV
jgi:hypothetical protein